MIYIDNKNVEQILTMEKCIEVMRRALVDLAEGKALQPLRTAMRLGNGNVLGLMPGCLPKQGVVGSKIITVFPHNHSEGLPSHQGVVLLFDVTDGHLKAIVDGIAITAIRTAAVSALATDVLARKAAANLAILGAGTQARTHLEAMLLVRDISQITVWDYHEEAAQRFVTEMSESYNVKIKCCSKVKQAVQDADIICTVSLAQQPILKVEWLKEGAHINAVGACTPNAREIDTATVVKARLFVDSVESAVNEAGCYLLPLAEGAITETHILGEIGDVLAGMIDGRTNEKEITLFKALGLAIEDLAAASFIYDEWVG